MLNLQIVAAPVAPHIWLFYYLENHMDEKAVNTNRYYLSGNLQNVADSKQIICYCINIQLLHGEDKMQRYHYPLEDGFTERIHTPGGVRSLVEDRN
ncbi:hypothetical protein DMI70_19375 [Escherichia coli]|nr:hypothetical protein [Escherichia coli]